MLFIMLLSVFLFRIGIVSQDGNKTISRLLLMVINPCVILTVYQTDFDERLVRGLLLAFAAGIAAHFIAILAARILIPAKNNPDYALERFASVYSNCGFLGIPLINSVLGSEGVFYLTAYMTVFNILAFTHGRTLLSGKFELKKLKEGLLSPVVIASLIAVILYFLQFRIPGVLKDSMQYIADMNTPAAMMIAGFSLAQSDIARIFRKWRIYRVTVVKLLVVPLLVLAFLKLFRIGHTVAYVTLIAAACPTSTTTTMLSIQLDKNYQYSSEIFSFTTVLSILTIPLVALAASFVL